MNAARQFLPRKPFSTPRTAANDGHYGSTRAISITHRQPDGRCRTINVIASTYVGAEISALDQMNFPGR
ncbi:MAG: hypothetical protein P4L87_25080 [Formivibrio sp.]|nr:hypothetical protein [Formivibrio sp.]